MKFYHDISEVYEFIFPFKGPQLEFIKSFINSNKKELSLLDIGCGIGDLSNQVANETNYLSAIDLSDSMIRKAKNKNHRDNLTFKAMDMMDCGKEFKPHSFDLVYCFGNTLVHLLSLEKIKAFFVELKKTMKAESVLLIQILNYNHIISKNIKTLPLLENDIIRFDRTYSYREDGLINFETKLLVKNNGQEWENSIPLLPIRKDDLNKLLLEVGFEEIRFYSNFNAKPYKADSLPLILSCKKQ